MASVIASGFKPSKPDKEMNFSNSYYAGFEVFTELGIVVASANNNAVKNVTKELPLVEKNVIDENNPLVREILIEDENTRRIWERFKSIATACLRKVVEQDSDSSPSRKKDLAKKDLRCALNISAVLGKKKYSDAFLETLRQQLKDFSKDSSFADLGAEKYKKAKIALEKAQKEFQEALREFEEVREELRFLNENEEAYLRLKSSIKRDNTEGITKELEYKRDKLRNLERSLQMLGTI